jgi:hypothetical protein
MDIELSHNTWFWGLQKYVSHNSIGQAVNRFQNESRDQI